MLPVVVIGAGITGLSAAWTLAQQGRPATLIEPGPLGGLMRTEHIDGCTVECGPDSWIRTKPALRQLASELGLAADVIACNHSLRGTCIFRAGRMIPLPRGLRLIAPTEWTSLLRSPLLSARTKLRMLAETARRPADRGDRTLAAFVEDHFGKEALEYVAEPLFAGVYGGTPESLGVAGVLPRMMEYERTQGSLIRGARRETPVAGPLFETMRGGLGQLTAALASGIEGRVTILSAPAESIAEGNVRVAGNWLAASRIVLACGAPASSKLLQGTVAGGLLGQIDHSSATIVALGYDQSALPALPPGFGFLVPRRERRVVMAGTWVSVKFTHRAPPGRLVMRVFLAGDHDDSIVPALLDDLRRMLNFQAPPLFTRVYRWPLSMPQYGVGHAPRIEAIRGKLPDNIVMAGAMLNGVGMPDCSQSGIDAVS